MGVPYYIYTHIHVHVHVHVHIHTCIYIYIYIQIVTWQCQEAEEAAREAKRAREEKRAEEKLARGVGRLVFIGFIGFIIGFIEFRVLEFRVQDFGSCHHGRLFPLAWRFGQFASG